MNKLGMNLFVWTMSMDEDRSDTFSFLKQSGFDFVEIPINNPDDSAKWQRIGRQCAELGLGVQTCTICSPTHSLISPDEAVRRDAVDFLKRVVYF